MSLTDNYGVFRADEELIRSVLAREPEGSSESQAFGLDNITKPYSWMIVEDNRLVALAGWRPLPWDSDILGFPCGRIDAVWARGDYLEGRRRLGKLFNRCATEAQEQGVSFLSLRLDDADLAALHAAEDSGFRVIESYLTFARDTDQIPRSDQQARLAQQDEVEGVGNIACRAFRYHRYLRDPLILDERARLSRQEWVRSAFKGRAEVIYVTEDGDNLTGFVLLRTIRAVSDTKVGLIDLIAVDPDYTGQGFGSALVVQAIRHYHGRIPTIEVGTQASNLPSIGLYTRMGFKLIRSEFSLHRHPKHARQRKRQAL